MILNHLVYRIIDGGNITNEIADEFIEHLAKQGKVTIPTVEKVKTCYKITLCYADNELIGIGALKLNGNVSFEKAGLFTIKDIFNLELGYFFVSESFRGLGISTSIARLLLIDNMESNILATTELYSNNPMLKTLEKLGFRHFGLPWKSKWHDGTIGLFLRFKKGIKSSNPITI